MPIRPPLTVFIWVLSTLAALCLTPSTAAAQYKNSAFAFDVGGWLVTKPGILGDDGQVLPPRNRPLRLANGLRIGGETNFKMDADKWWFSGRANIGFLRYFENAKGTELERRFDAEAASNVGTIMALQVGMGVRYFFLTDRFRPYLQAGLSFMHLLSFNSLDDDCGMVGLCDLGGSFGDNFLPHRNVGAVHLQPGVEFIFTRDTAIHVFVDVQQWIIINAKPNQAVIVGAGMTFYSG